ncbi:MAG TPA: ATP-binding protein [Rhodocyclaceae bacterium]|nr:ATP-binding protein [Rhodocyclaceae bacterium]
MGLSSLKARITLLTSLLAGLLWLLAVGATWLEARHEAEELFDAHLVQSASLLIAQTRLELEHEHWDDDDAFQEDHAPQLHRYGRRVAFQVWIGGRLRLHSANAPDEPLSATREGLSDSRVGDEGWRVFSAWDGRRQALVQVGERVAAREKMAQAVAAGLLRPLLVALPLLAVLIWLAVRQGVRPLDRVAGELGQRSPEHLALLPAHGLPSEVLPLVERLNALFARVARTFEQERRFTADAAHELRTPLAGLKAQAQVALGAADDGARRHALESVIQGCDRMTRLVEQLLVLARVDATRPADFVAVDLAAVASEAVAQLAPQAVAKGIDIELQADGAGTIRGNPAWLAVLVRNLADNAVRYSPPGGRVTVAVAAEDGSVALRVEDTGPGVAAEELACLGQRFWRSLERGPEAGEDGGSGLGLSIVGRIVALHGGSLEFANAGDGHGLRVEVRLPRAPDVREDHEG